jgi:VWFA-related protein
MKERPCEKVKGRRGERALKPQALCCFFTVSPLHLFTLSLLLLFSFTAAAQSGRRPPADPRNPGTQRPGEKPVFRLETKEVVVPLSAYDPLGNLVNDLTTKDVVVLEDGEPRPVSFIRHEPANIVLILDLNNELGTFKNGSHLSWMTSDEERKPRDGQKPMWEKRENYQVIARPATREFADNLVARLSPSDSLAIIQYADKVQLVQNWTSDRREATQSLNAKYRIGLKGRFYDALKLAADKLEERKTGRRIVVLISDGMDSASKTTRQQALAALAKVQASTFVVGWSDVLKDEITAAMQRTKAGMPAGIDLLGNARKRLEELQRYARTIESASVLLRDLAENSGGECLLPPSYQDLVISPKRLAEEIGAQYSLAFVTESRPSLENTRSIEVLPARKGLTVRSRRSYWVNNDSRWSILNNTQ